MATQALWQRLQQLRHDFFLLYLAYHHFRSKVRQCWNPRLGSLGMHAALSGP